MQMQLSGFQFFQLFFRLHQLHQPLHVRRCQMLRAVRDTVFLHSAYHIQ